MGQEDRQIARRWNTAPRRAARQKQMRFEDEDFYVDLVFNNRLLQCFVLGNLKVGRLTHQDIGRSVIIEYRKE